VDLIWTMRICSLFSSSFGLFTHEVQGHLAKPNGPLLPRATRCALRGGRCAPRPTDLVYLISLHFTGLHLIHERVFYRCVSPIGQLIDVLSHRLSYRHASPIGDLIGVSLL
jgi:hypothetical protein